LVTLTSWLAVFSVGCGTEDGRTPAAPIVQSDFAASLANASCDFAFRCCIAVDRGSLFNVDPSTLPDLASCESVEGSALAASVAESIAGGEVYDAALGGECVANIQSLPCGFIPEIKDIPACRAALRVPATLVEGALCNDPQDCISGACGGTGVDFVCIAAAASSVGAACTGDGSGSPDTCAGGVTYCSALTSQCTTKQARGASCGESRECQHGLRCLSGRCDFQGSDGCTGL
jgi:hypothetical protein